MVVTPTMLMTTAVVALWALVVAPAVSASSPAITVSAASAVSTVSSGLPDGVPAAALRPEPALPVPAGWPFADAFPRTSGTGRLIAGALEWSDFLYDDHGAKGVPVDTPVASLAAPVGTYTYPDGPAAMNGADIFRVGIGATSDATWWRVDWNTLVDPNVPIAEFGIDLDNNPGTGATVGLFKGIDVTITMSAKGGATIASLTNGAAHPGAQPLTVDRAARSFVARIPRAVFDPAGAARVQLVAGLADASGHDFVPVTNSNGALPNQPPYYNVAFRSFDQEPEASNYWMESAQANALANNDISAFARVIRWNDLRDRVTTREPRPTGYTNRWFVTSLDLGQGVVKDGGGGAGDLLPNFLGRVQPYAIYVPKHYDGQRPVPLTFILHSLNEQHNQYGSLDPKFVTEACEARTSICVTPLGRGPDGWYFDEAEVDFWEVWNRVASAYRLDPERTALSGYSMGGWGTYKLGLAHPDVFAKAVVLEGPVVCGIRVVSLLPRVSNGGKCTTDGDSLPVLASARNLPYLISQGVADELVPVEGVVQNVLALKKLGYRYRFELYPLADHLVYPIFDAFSDQAAHLSDAPRVHDPAHVTYTWFPNLDRTDYGIGATTAYWLRDMKARTVAPGRLASIDAETDARRHPAITVRNAVGALVPGDPHPAIVDEQTWALGASTRRALSMRLQFRDVGSVVVDAARAGFTATDAVTMHVTTDGPVRITVRVPLPDAHQPVGARTASFDVPTGVHDVVYTPARITGVGAPVVAAATRSRRARLPATGGADAAPALLLVAAGAAGATTAARTRRRARRSG